MARRHVIMLEGHLEGMGRIEGCFVIAVKVPLQGTDRYKYEGASIHRAPEDLPDGPYTVLFDGRRGRVKLLGGRWYAGDLVSIAINA